MNWFADYFANRESVGHYKAPVSPSILHKGELLELKWPLLVSLKGRKPTRAPNIKVFFAVTDFIYEAKLNSCCNKLL